MPKHASAPTKTIYQSDSLFCVYKLGNVQEQMMQTRFVCTLLIFNPKQYKVPDWGPWPLEWGGSGRSDEISVIWSDTQRGGAEGRRQEFLLPNHQPACVGHRWMYRFCCCCCLLEPEQALWTVERMKQAWLREAGSDWMLKSHGQHQYYETLRKRLRKTSSNNSENIPQGPL